MILIVTYSINFQYRVAQKSVYPYNYATMFQYLCFLIFFQMAAVTLLNHSCKIVKSLQNEFFLNDGGSSIMITHKLV